MSLVLPSSQLISELQKIGFKRPVGIKDREVLCPTVDWLDRFCEWMKLNHHHAYVPDKYDCEDFAWDAVSDATDSLLQNGKVAKVGHSFLLCTVGISAFEEINGVLPEEKLSEKISKLVLINSLNGVPGSGDLHSCNICRTVSGWYLVEPQNGQRTAVAGLADDTVLLWDVVIV